MTSRAGNLFANCLCFWQSPSQGRGSRENVPGWTL